MKKLFAITCKYTPQKSFVYGSVDNILKHYPRSDIVIVDSCSEDKTYLADLRSKYPTVMTEDVCNQNYEYGGTVHAFNKFKNKYDDFFTVNEDGTRNGAVRITKSEHVKSEKMSRRVGSMFDKCTNIHSVEDLKKAERNINERVH